MGDHDLDTLAVLGLPRLPQQLGARVGRPRAAPHPLDPTPPEFLAQLAGFILSTSIGGKLLSTASCIVGAAC